MAFEDRLENNGEAMVYHLTPTDSETLALDPIPTAHITTIFNLHRMRAMPGSPSLSVFTDLAHPIIICTSIYLSLLPQPLELK